MTRFEGATVTLRMYVVMAAPMDMAFEKGDPVGVITTVVAAQDENGAYRQAKAKLEMPSDVAAEHFWYFQEVGAEDVPLSV